MLLDSAAVQNSKGKNTLKICLDIDRTSLLALL